MEYHELMGGKLRLYKRSESGYWQCSAYLGGKNRRVSTKEDGLSRAKDFAEDWYLGMRGKTRNGELPNGKPFRFAADQFMKEFPVITNGERNAHYVKRHGDRLRVYLNPFFGNKAVTEVTPGLVQEYRIYRSQNSCTGKAPARSTVHQEIVLLRQILKTAQRHGWLAAVPDLSMPYRTAGKVTHRAWFSPVEYRQLYEATRERAKNPKQKQYQWQNEQLHDYVLFMANTGIRPDEASQLQYRDVSVEHDDATDETILVIEVRGKRGVGYCKSTKNAVRPFTRLRRRNDPAPTDLLFPNTHRTIFNDVLDELGLKTDRDGNRRTAYSLRHTYISFRLMEGADIYQIAKNCRTSVEMIEKHYAIHLKNSLDAAAINVRKERTPKSPSPQRLSSGPSQFVD
jgi:integrase